MCKRFIGGRIVLAYNGCIFGVTVCISIVKFQCFVCDPSLADFRKFSSFERFIRPFCGHFLVRNGSFLRKLWPLSSFGPFRHKTLNFEYLDSNIIILFFQFYMVSVLVDLFIFHQN